MRDNVPMVAIMTLPAFGVARGDTFGASEQDARDLEQAGRATRAEPPEAPKAARKG